MDSKVGELHRYLLTRSGHSEAVKMILKEACPKLNVDPVSAASMIPENPSIRSLAFAIAMGHFVYGDSTAVVLFIVQPGERNVSLDMICFSL